MVPISNYSHFPPNCSIDHVFTLQHRPTASASHPTHAIKSVRAIQTTLSAFEFSRSTDPFLRPKWSLHTAYANSNVSCIAIHRLITNRCVPNATHTNPRNLRTRVPNTDIPTRPIRQHPQNDVAHSCHHLPVTPDQSPRSFVCMDGPAAPLSRRTLDKRSVATYIRPAAWRPWTHLTTPPPQRWCGYPPAGGGGPPPRGRYEAGPCLEPFRPPNWWSIAPSGDQHSAPHKPRTDFCCVHWPSCIPGCDATSRRSAA